MRYRIKEYKYSNGTTEYVIQRKSIFGFWCNPDNIDEYTTGIYNSYEEAEQVLNEKINNSINITYFYKIIDNCGNFIKQIFCRHRYRIVKDCDDHKERMEFLNNLKDGESVNFIRLHRCTKCGKEKMIGSGIMTK